MRGTHATTARIILESLAAGAAYYALAWTFLSLRLESTTASPLWPAAGLAAAAALNPGSPALAAVFLASAAVNWRFLSVVPDAPLGAVAACCLAIAAGTVAQAVVGAWALRRWLPDGDFPAERGSVWRFTAIALLTCVISATCGVGASVLSGLVSPLIFVIAWSTWWIGDCLGLLVVLPAILAWRRPDSAPSPAGAATSRAAAAARAAAALCALAVSIWIGFSGPFDDRSLPLIYLPYPVLFWIAGAHGPRETALAVLLTAVLSSLMTAQGYGPFAAASDATRAQLLVATHSGVAAISTFLVRALFAERERDRAQLIALQQTLKERLDSRELGLLQAGFALELATVGREERERRLMLFRNTVAGLPHGLVILRLARPGDAGSFEIAEMNPSALKLARDAREYRPGMPLRAYAPEVYESGLAGRFLEALRTGEVLAIPEYESRRRAAGAAFALKAFPVSDAELAVVFEDVTERKRAQTELAQFAYVASHDLQEPLRKASALADRLRESLGGELSDESADWLARLLRSLGGMQSLIDALLQLARVSTRAETPESVDLEALAREVVDGLHDAAPGRVEISFLPRVHAGRSQMRQLLQNLIANALKFRKPGEEPRVRVRALAAADGRCAVEVEDDGIGLDMKHAEKIFQPFTRLNGRQAYPGTGMGLAICQRIAERHGGTVTVRSEPGRGSTFTVTLPRARDEEAAYAVAEKAPAGGSS